METLDKNFWNTRWENADTGWDIGYSSPAIAEYVAQYPNKNGAVLIPGCGNAYEAETLLNLGFSNITLIDIAPKAVERLQQKFKGVAQTTVLCEDFFTHKGAYDLILEQTFLSALLPEKRAKYAEKMASLLNENGKLVGVLFDKDFGNPAPPFGGSKEEYEALFAPYFDIQKIEKCYNSITPRKNNEVFINLNKKTRL